MDELEEVEKGHSFSTDEWRVVSMFERGAAGGRDGGHVD